MKFQNTFLVNFPKKLRFFKAEVENLVTFWKIHKEGILKFHNREVNKNSDRRFWKFKDFVLTVLHHNIPTGKRKFESQAKI